jgi:hypothetical protein
VRYNRLVLLKVEREASLMSCAAAHNFTSLQDRAAQVRHRTYTAVLHVEPQLRLSLLASHMLYTCTCLQHTTQALRVQHVLAIMEYSAAAVCLRAAVSLIGTPVQWRQYWTVVGEDADEVGLQQGP